LAAAPALQVATIPIAAVGGAFLARAWWLQIHHGSRSMWRRRSLLVLVISTATVIALWSLRFAGVIG
jgi:hypothetical protein